MQKISSYLYSNRTLVIADLACYPVEWKLVYQRTIKLYKGMDNLIEFDVRNAEQKRVSISNYTMKCVIMDANNKEVLTADVDTTSANCSTGIALMLISAADIDYLVPQFLKYTLYIENLDGSKTPVYGDTQFGLGGTIQLLGGALPEETAPQVINTFYYINNDGLLNPTINTWYSESVEVNPKNDINEQHVINLEFWLENFEAEVTVQITTDAIVHAFTDWSDLETFTITTTTDRINKIYSEVADYSNNIGWLRVTYEPTANNTGKIDRIVVRS
jgi:hypothetical protein